LGFQVAIFGANAQVTTLRILVS